MRDWEERQGGLSVRAIEGSTRRIEEGRWPICTGSGSPVPHTVGACFLDSVEYSGGLEYREKGDPEAPALVGE